MMWSCTSRKYKQIGAAMLAAVFTAVSLSAMFTASAASSKTLYEKVQDKAQKLVEEPSYPYYSDYLAQDQNKGYKDYAGSPVELSQNAAVASPKGNYIQNNVSGLGKSAIVWQGSSLKSLAWTADVPASGYYNIEVDYIALAGSTAAPQRTLSLDGNIYFKEMNVFTFQRIWKNGGSIWVNALKNQVRPKLVEDAKWQTMRLSDSQGNYAQPLRFYLTAGKHIITMGYNSEPLAIGEIRLVAPAQYKTYSQVRQEYSADGYKNAQTDPITIQAEDASARSDPSLRIQDDTDPDAYPSSSKGSIVYNSIGGTAWNTGGQSISWVIKAPKDGLYKIATRYKQNYTDGLPVFRRIAVDGTVPFEEFMEYRFSYERDWNTKEMTDSSGNPYEIYLTAGSHTLTMTVVNGPYTPIINELENDAKTMDAIILEIEKITTFSPDTNYDYELDKKLPDLVPNMKKLENSLNQQIEKIKKIADKTPSAVNNLSMVAQMLQGMISDTYDIPKKLSSFTSAQTNMSTWISSLNSSPLLLDYITISSPDGSTKNYHSNVFQKIGAAFANYVQSYFKDYDLVNNNKSGSGKTINLWYSQAKEWAEVLQNMTDEEFTKQTGINVKMNLVPANSFSTNGVILLAIASGTGPDMALGVSQNVPFEYGCRGSLVDLNTFSDAKQITSRFVPGILIPYEQNKSLYALPETMDFSVMFYRKDIMQTLQLPVPQTWDELFDRDLPTLQKAGLNFYYDGGYHNFLLENGGSYYSKDGKKSGLDTPQAFKAFKQFTDLFTIYNLPVNANFYQTFRNGTIPLGVSNFNTYMQIAKGAPELAGEWDVTEIPGVKQADGQINRAYGGSSTGTMILKSSKVQNECWQYLKWYTSANTQVEYANTLIASVGSDAMWSSANIEAFSKLPWDTNLKNVVLQQSKWYQDMPNVIGGYITPRYIENARVAVVIQGKQYRDSLEEAVKEINRELTNKNQEFAMRASVSRGNSSEKK